MIAARVAGRADARVLHRLAQLLLVDELAGGLHRRQQRALGVAARRLGLLLLGGDLRDRGLLAVLRASAAAARGPRRRRGRAVGVGGLAVHAAPAGDQHQLAAGAEHVAVGDRGLDARVLEHRVGVEDGQEAAHDQVVDPAVVLVHLLDRVALGAGRDDRVVVGDLGVVDHAAERQHVEPEHVLRRPRAYSRCSPTSFAIGLISPIMSLGDVARVRARIGQRLVLLVQALGGGQRAARREPEAAVGVALQRGQVVEQRRALLALALVELGDLAGLAVAGGDDRGRLLGGLDPRVGARVDSGPRSVRGPSSTVSNAASTTQ